MHDFIKLSDFTSYDKDGLVWATVILQVGGFGRQASCNFHTFLLRKSASKSQKQ